MLLLLGTTLRHAHRRHPVLVARLSLQPLHVLIGLQPMAVLIEGRGALAHMRGEACVLRRQGTEVRRCR